MKVSPQNFARIYLVLITLSIYMYRFEGILDRAPIQYFFISLVNLASLISIPFIFSGINITKVIKNPLFICYSGYFLMSIISIIVAINPIESLVKINQLTTFILMLGIFLFLINEKVLKLNDLLFVSTITLLVDITFSLEQYVYMLLNDIPYKYDYVTNLVGLQGNRNILATTIAFRIPLLILLIKKIKKYYLLGFLLLCVAFFNIMLLSSRATILAIILSSVFLLLLGLYMYFIKNRAILSNNWLSLSFYILPLFIAYQVSNYVINPDDISYVSSRMSSIVSSNDDSKNTRIRYYTQSVKHIMKYPLLGAGIGNWKILSIKYDSENLQNYIVPYNAHNDILEATAETGIIGGGFFIAFFIFIFYELLKILRIKDQNYIDYQFKLILFLPFIVYMIDLNLNFPSHRPVNLYLLLIYISVILLLKQKLTSEKK